MGSVRMRSGIVSRRTCCSTAWISGRSRSTWGTRTSRRMLVKQTPDDGSRATCHRLVLRRRAAASYLHRYLSSAGLRAASGGAKGQGVSRTANGILDSAKQRSKLPPTPSIVRQQRPQFARIGPVLPARPAASLEASRCSRPRAQPPVQPTSSVSHGGRLTGGAAPGLGSTSRCLGEVTRAIPIS